MAARISAPCPWLLCLRGGLAAASSACRSPGVLGTHQAARKPQHRPTTPRRSTSVVVPEAMGQPLRPLRPRNRASFALRACCRQPPDDPGGLDPLPARLAPGARLWHGGRFHHPLHAALSGRLTATAASARSDVSSSLSRCEVRVGVLGGRRGRSGRAARRRRLASAGDASRQVAKYCAKVRAQAGKEQGAQRRTNHAAQEGTRILDHHFPQPNGNAGFDPLTSPSAPRISTKLLNQRRGKPARVTD